MFVQNHQPADRRRMMGQTKHSLFSVIAVGVLFAAGCSSEPAPTDASEPATASTQVPTSTEAPEVVTTTAPTTSETPATTEAPEVVTTTAPVTTEAPVTTGDGEPTQADLEAALAAQSKAWVDCAAAMPRCDPEALSASRSGDQLQSSADIVRGANTNGWTVTNLEAYRTQFESAEFESDVMAFVTACNEDGLVVTDQAGGLVSDRFSSTRSLWTYELIDGVWKVTTGVRIEQAIGQENSLCAF